MDLFGGEQLWSGTVLSVDAEKSELIRALLCGGSCIVPRSEKPAGPGHVSVSAHPPVPQPGLPVPCGPPPHPSPDLSVRLFPHTPLLPGSQGSPSDGYLTAWFMEALFSFPHLLFPEVAGASSLQLTPGPGHLLIYLCSKCLYLHLLIYLCYGSLLWKTKVGVGLMTMSSVSNCNKDVGRECLFEWVAHWPCLSALH